MKYLKEIKALIVDDEIDNINLMEHFLKKYCPQITTIISAKNKTEAISLIEKEEPQILFLDIMLEECTGFDILDEIEEINSQIIFVSAFSEHAIKTFKYNTVDFLVKPVDIEHLIAAVNNAIKRIQLNVLVNESQLTNIKNEYAGDDKNDFIAVSNLNDINVIKKRDILYLKSEGKYTCFYLTNNEQIISSKNLGVYESLLAGNDFIRIHNSYIININFLIKIMKKDGVYAVLNGNILLPVSKRKQLFLEKQLHLK